VGVAHATRRGVVLLRRALMLLIAFMVLARPVSADNGLVSQQEQVKQHLASAAAAVSDLDQRIAGFERSIADTNQRIQWERQELRMLARTMYAEPESPLLAAFSASTLSQALTRFGSRYGEFVIANTLQSAGNAALGYEPRYDLCRCTGFWPRTRHAIARNFVTYNRTERERRAAIPLYAGSFGAGMISSLWLPGHRNPWKEGAYSALVQAGLGSGVNWASEFAIDIFRKITNNRYPKPE